MISTKRKRPAGNAVSGFRKNKKKSTKKLCAFCACALFRELEKILKTSTKKDKYLLRQFLLSVPETFMWCFETWTFFSKLCSLIHCLPTESYTHQVNSNMVMQVHRLHTVTAGTKESSTKTLFVSVFNRCPFSMGTSTQRPMEIGRAHV